MIFLDNPLFLYMAQIQNHYKRHAWNINMQNPYTKVLYDPFWTCETDREIHKKHINNLKYKNICDIMEI